MADITMCSGKDCPLRGTCKRFMGKPTMLFQPYFKEAPYDKTVESCGNYYKI